MSIIELLKLNLGTKYTVLINQFCVSIFHIYIYIHIYSMRPRTYLRVVPSNNLNQLMVIGALITDILILVWSSIIGYRVLINQIFVYIFEDISTFLCQKSEFLWISITPKWISPRSMINVDSKMDWWIIAISTQAELPYRNLKLTEENRFSHTKKLPRDLLVYARNVI